MGSLWREMTTDLKQRPLWQRIGLIACLSGAGSCLLVGLLGLVMIEYWHHVTGDWMDNHCFFWLEVGAPTTIGTFAFTRLMDLFH